jgi:hypothetical protein
MEKHDDRGSLEDGEIHQPQRLLVRLTAWSRTKRLRAGLHPKEDGGSMPVKATKKNDSHPMGRRKWSAGVTTDSTHPREGLFNQDAKTIARELASKKVSPKGPSSGMRMLTFYINRAGKNLPANRVRVLENAKQLLHDRILAAKDQEKKASRKKTA